MTAEEVSRVEALVNSWVGAASDVATRVMALDDARAAGATAMFGEKYDDVVRVVDVPGVSMELCGGEGGDVHGDRSSSSCCSSGTIGTSLASIRVLRWCRP
jgi:alanyl-tRNA synthetase